MVALTGEVSAEREYIQTLGRGDKILNWTLSAAALTSDSTATEQREYEKDSWLPENQWSLLLEKGNPILPRHGIISLRSVISLFNDLNNFILNFPLLLYRFLHILSIAMVDKTVWI